MVCENLCSQNNMATLPCQKMASFVCRPFDNVMFHHSKAYISPEERTVTRVILYIKNFSSFKHMCSQMGGEAVGTQLSLYNSRVSSLKFQDLRYNDIDFEIGILQRFKMEMSNTLAFILVYFLTTQMQISKKILLLDQISLRRSDDLGQSINMNLYLFFS